MNGHILIILNDIIKVSRDEIGLYIIDPSQTIAALNNYHRNRNIDKFLEYSKKEEIKIGKTTYKRKDYITDSQYKSLWSLQRQAEKNATSMSIKFTQLDSIRRRLELHGSELEQTELVNWSKLADKLNDEYDLLIKKADTISYQQRQKILNYLFGVSEETFKKYYNDLLILSDGLYLSIINLYDKAENVGVKDIISTVMDNAEIDNQAASYAQSQDNSMIEKTKDIIKDRN